MYIFVVPLLFAHLCVVASCPEGCTCDDSSRRVDCTSISLQLERIPSDIPEDTRQLYVKYQNITRIYREDFMRVPGLVILDLSYNNIRVIDQDALIDLVNLTELRLQYNSISMIGGLTLDHLQKLELLYLSNNPELVMTPCALAGLVSLRVLYLHGTNVTYGPDLFSGGAGCEGEPYPPLETLLIQNTPTMMVDAETLSHPPGITTLFIGADGFELTWRSLEMLHQLSRLSIYYPSSDILHNDIPSSLGNLNQLVLYFVGDFPPSFPGHHRLQRLDIFQSSFTRLPPHAFTNVPSLEVLHIAGGALAHIDRDALRSLVKLTVLWLPDNNIQTLPAGLLSDIPSSFTFSHFGLGSNPLICDCNIEWLVEFISDRGIEDGGGTCFSPAGLAGTRLNELTDDNFINCQLTTAQSTTAIPEISSMEAVRHGLTRVSTSVPTRESVPSSSPEGASYSTSIITTAPHVDPGGMIGASHELLATSTDDGPYLPVTGDGTGTNEHVNIWLIAVLGLGSVLVVTIIIFCMTTLTMRKRLREKKHSQSDNNTSMMNMTASNTGQSNAANDSRPTDHGNANPALYYQSIDDDEADEQNLGMSGIEMKDASTRTGGAGSSPVHQTVGTAGSDGTDEEWGNSRAYDRRMINTERPHYSGSIVKDDKYDRRIVPDSGPYYSSAIRK